MFHKTSLKLAALYLTIIMAISLAFSINLYNISVREIDRGLRRQQSAVISDLPNLQNITPNPFGQFSQERETNLSEAKNHLITNLILINIVILLGGGLLSYFLARRSLLPIEKAHEAQSRFTADASHELRTPIAAMRTETEVALMNPKLDLGQAKKQLESNLEELGKLTTLSENLLRLSQVDKLNLKKEPVKVKQFIDSAIERVLPSAEAKSILINSNTSAELSVIGDKASLQEVITTILDNAIKYSPDKTEIKVTAKKIDNLAVISIKDHGIGIKTEDLDHIFERFYRADTARSKAKTNGYGLGLAIAKSVVDLHEGTIEVTSQPDKGSVFIIKLPL
jgi:signal transduction histidine kinase